MICLGAAKCLKRIGVREINLKVYGAYNAYTLVLDRQILCVALVHHFIKRALMRILCSICICKVDKIHGAMDIFQSTGNNAL